MEDINFCPFCDAPTHKIFKVNEKFNFCKECDKFFELEEFTLKCPKCNKSSIGDSDFPGPSGELIFHCRSCKKMFSAQEFLKENGIL